MQRTILWILAGVSLAAPALAQTPAQAPAQTPALKVAFINSRQILQATPGYATAESTFTRELAGYRAEIQKLQQQLDSAVNAFDQQSIALSPAAKQSKQHELQQMQERLQQRNTEIQTRMQQREQELLQPIQDRVNGIIQGIRAETNYAFIFDADAPNSGIVAADPALNITPKVLQRLQQAN
ncbi:MAG TPA: OmpH family outer membrane protein [Gemmatimonadales bacterium]|nr:OmpH family outer membrane protein [Gemmatimonadales bacterium]